MKLFFISYDLITPGQKYQLVYNKLISIGAKKLLESMWVVKGTYTASNLRDVIKSCVDSNDRIFVVESADWASFNALCNVNEV